MVLVVRSLVESKTVLHLWIRIGTLYGGYLLTGGHCRTYRSGRAHIKAIGRGIHVLHFLVWIHFLTANILGCNRPGLVLERDLVVDALGYQICIAFTSGIEEIQLLAPITVTLRFCAVGTGGLGFVALEMALSTRQAAGASALWLSVWSSITVSLLRWSRSARGRVTRLWRGERVCHVMILSQHSMSRGADAGWIVRFVRRGPTAAAVAVRNR